MRFSDDLSDAFESDGTDDTELEAELDEEFPLGDGTAAMDAVVACPYCGENVEIALDRYLDHLRVEQADVRLTALDE